MADRDNLKIEVVKSNSAAIGNQQITATFSGALCWDIDAAEYDAQRMYEKTLDIAAEAHRRVFACLSAGQSGTIHSPTKWLEDQRRMDQERIATLEKANADLHSRLDELRRVVARFGAPLVSIPAASRDVRGGDGKAWTGRGYAFVPNETASDRLAEHNRRHHLDKRPGEPFSERSDPAGGG